MNRPTVGQYISIIACRVEPRALRKRDYQPTVTPSLSTRCSLLETRRITNQTHHSGFVHIRMYTSYINVQPNRKRRSKIVRLVTTKENTLNKRLFANTSKKNKTKTKRQHEIILEKNNHEAFCKENYDRGVNGIFTKIFSSYLTNRKKKYIYVSIYVLRINTKGNWRALNLRSCKSRWSETTDFARVPEYTCACLYTQREPRGSRVTTYTTARTCYSLSLSLSLFLSLSHSLSGYTSCFYTALLFLFNELSNSTKKFANSGILVYRVSYEYLTGLVLFLFCCLYRDWWLV